MNPRTIKAKTPLSVWIAAVAIGLGLLTFIGFATWYSIAQIQDAKMTGVVVKKEFQPAPEHQVTVSKKDGISEQDVEGEFVVTVEVPQKDGTKKAYNVWMPDRKSYEALKIGDSYDVGPRLVR